MQSLPLALSPGSGHRDYPPSTGDLQCCFQDSPDRIRRLIASRYLLYSTRTSAFGAVGIRVERSEGLRDYVAIHG